MPCSICKRNSPPGYSPGICVLLFWGTLLGLTGIVHARYPNLLPEAAEVQGADLTVHSIGANPEASLRP